MTRPRCTVAGCGRPHYGHGYCRAHHARWRRHGDPRAGSPIATRTADAVLDVERAARLYAAGVSSRGVAAVLGISRDAVLRELRAHGVAIRPPVAPPRPSRRRPVTPAASQSGRPSRDHRTNDSRHPVPIFTTDITKPSTMPSTQPSTPRISTTRTSTPDQNQG